MVANLIKSSARQIILEKLDPSYSGDGTRLALLLVCGYDVHSFDREIGTCKGYNRSLYDYAWIEYMVCGLHPVIARRTHQHTTTNPVSGGTGGGDYTCLQHPINLASMYLLEGDTEKARLVLDEYEIIKDSLRISRDKNVQARMTERPLYKWESYISSRTWIRGLVNPVDPVKYGLSTLPMHRELDSVYTMSWFGDAGFSEVANSNINHGHNVDILAQISGLHGGRWHPLLRRAAYKAAKEHALNNKKGHFPYGDLTTYLRLCEPSDATAVMSEVKGARRALGVVRPDATPAQMVTGLQELAGSSEEIRLLLLARLGRMPTLDEFRKVRSKGLVDILWSLPTETLDALYTKYGDDLRSLVLPFATDVDPGLLRECLDHHKKRPEAQVPNINETTSRKSVMRLSDKTTIADWSHIFGNIIAIYKNAELFRQTMNGLTGDLAISALFALKLFKNESSPHIEDVLRHHTNFDHAIRLVEDFRKGFVTIPRSANWDTWASATWKT